MRGREKEREGGGGEKDEGEEVKEDDKEDGLEDCVNWMGCEVCLLFESFSISTAFFESFSISITLFKSFSAFIPLCSSFPIPSPPFSPFSSLSPLSAPFAPFSSLALCAGFNVPNRTDEHPNRKETARIAGPSIIDSLLQYAEPDPWPIYKYPE